MEFRELNLHPDLQRGIAEAGYLNCMPVQEQVLSHAFDGQDLYVQSQTGTGKTAAFLIVIFQRLLAEELLAGKKAIIMVPTRELAVQVEEEAKALGKYLPFKIGSFYGGVGYTQQQQILKDNAQILVGTPGRVLDLNKSGRMNLMNIAFLVLDEADRMFDMGFYPDLRKLIKVVPPADRRQTMLFSATLNAWVKNLAWEYTKSPFEIEIEPEIVTVEEVEQILYHVPSEEKMRLLLGILEREKPESAIIFCNTKRYTEIVAKRLRINGYDCEFIIGDLPQTRRLKVIDDVKAGRIKYLVATDVAARGLDIEGLAMVVNYDLPVESENYVHRIGRTARAGKTGKAITLASEQDVYELPAIERYIGKKIPSEIAMSELHTEDKSAGMRIHTEVYGDRREERHPRGNAKAAEGRGARPHGQGRGGERAGAGRGERRGNRPHGGRDSGGGDRSAGARHPEAAFRDNAAAFREGKSSRKGVSAKGEARADKSSMRPAAERDLSQLSFEERMALYKKKYAAGSRSGGGEAAFRGGQSPQAAGGEGKGRSGAGRPVNNEGKRGGGRNRKRRKARPGAAGQGAAGRAPAGEKAETPRTPKAAVPEQAAPKKGIISRLLETFRKK
ncbi:MAG: DEAD/DEAH box helicase [Treponema sp.]|jgi:ATP-dependent RNA helicase RhlB|nr:DEAD/DEAH box helicase [Treponema sp.]